MKRMIAMCLMTMLMLSVALVVYGDPGNQSTTVNFSVSGDSYVIDIPKSVSANSGSLEVTVLECHTELPIYVSISSNNYNQTYGWKMLKNGNSQNNPIYYQISVDGNNYIQGDVFALTGNMSKTLNFSIVRDNFFKFAEEGSYYDTLTFAFSLGNY